MARVHPRYLAMAALAALTACGGSGGGTGAMSVHLVDGPTPEYSAVLLDVKSVSIHSAADGWITLGSPDKVIDLLKLTGGVAETLADGATLPAGHYDQMRLLLGPNNSVILSADQSEHALKVPSGMQSGVKLNVSFDVAPNTTKDVFIDFDAHRSVFLHQAGASGQYLLRPVVRAFDKLVTGAILGTLTDATTTAPLPGVTVTAQTVTSGSPAVVRTTITGIDGKYALDLLPIGGTYYVVAQPVVGASVYDAKSSPATGVTEAAPTPTRDVAFALAASSGTLSGDITPLPGADESDVVSLLQSLDVGAVSPQTLVVRTAAAGFDGVTDAYAFANLPFATYGAVVTRQGQDASGNATFASSAPTAVTFNASPMTQNLVAP